MVSEQPIFIVSPPRSGSSFTAHVLSELGVFIGKTKPADKWNVNGYYENERMRALIVNYMRLNDKEHLRKRYNPENLSADYPHFKDLMLAIATGEGCANGQPWLFKDPKIAYCWQMMNRSFPNARWLIVRRKRSEVLASIKRTEFMDAYSTDEEWIGYLERYSRMIDRLEAGCKNVMSIKVSSLMRLQDDALASLMEFCQTPVTDIDIARSRIDSIIVKDAWNTKK
jgi:hypothetical protein